MPPALREGEELFCASAKWVQKAWDHSSLSLLKACPRKYQLAIIEGYRPNAPSAALEWGGFYAKGQEIYAKLRAQGQAHEPAQLNLIREMLELTEYPVFVVRDKQGNTIYRKANPRGGDTWPMPSHLTFDDIKVYNEVGFWTTRDSERTRETLIRSLVWYTEQFQNDSAETMILEDGTPAVELSFRLDLPIKTPDGDPYLWCGHIDRVVKFGGYRYVHECKHTTTTVSSRFFERFNPNSQITGYDLSASVILKEPVVGTIVDASQVAVNFTRFQRGITTRTKEQLDEWMHSTMNWISVAEGYALAGYWPMNEESCGNYGGCQFRGVCSKAPLARQSFLDTEFHREPWNPLKNRGQT